MNKHHQHTSFNTYAQRVLGTTRLSEQELALLEGELSYSRNVESSNGKHSFSVQLLSDGKSVKSAEQVINTEATIQSSCLVEPLLVARLKTLNEGISALGNEAQLLTDAAESALANLADILTYDYGLTKGQEDNIFSAICMLDVLKLALPHALNVAILLDKERPFAMHVLHNLLYFLESEAFTAKPANIRALQKILAFLVSRGEDVSQKLSATAFKNTPQCVDAIVSLLVTASSDKEEFEAAFDKLALSEQALVDSNFYLTIQTLNRSPVKLNMIWSSSLFGLLAETLTISERTHVELCFRALYFLESANSFGALGQTPVEVIEETLGQSDRKFNELYRDVRRSTKKVITLEELQLLLQGVGEKDYSLNKWVYLFTLLSGELVEKEKLAFLERVLIEKGLPGVTTQEPLTLVASLGLKSLTAQIVNDAYQAFGVTPVMPVTDDYRLGDVFANVLSAELARRPEAECGDKVSVVITTYNPNLELLRLSIASILQQTYSNIEVLVVDDCSQIPSGNDIEEVCKSFAEADVRYIRNRENVGQYISRNVAISQSSGDYIAIQDDDDVSHPERISTQVGELKNSHQVASFTKHIRFTDDGALSIDDPRNLLALGDGPASLLFKKELLQLTGGFRDYRSRGDIDFRTRIESMLGSELINYIDSPLYIMRSSLDTISSLYEYKNGDQLEYFRNRISLLKKKKAQG